MNIYQKIVEIRKSIDGFQKDGKGHNYKYVTGSQVLCKIKTKMDELGVVLEQHLLNQEHHTHTYKTKYNEITDFVVTGEMKMVWVNADDPIDRAEVSWQMAGQQDDISKAIGSGLTYAERYFVLKYFGIPTDEDDPDAKKKPPENKPPVAPPQNPNLITPDQIKIIFATGKNDNAKIKEVYLKYGYINSKDIKISDYDKIIKELETNNNSSDVLG